MPGVVGRSGLRPRRGAGAFVPDDDPSGLTLNEISRRTGLPLSTTVRLIGELLDGGMLQRDNDLRYSTGPPVNEFGHARRAAVAGPSLRGCSGPPRSGSCRSAGPRHGATPERSVPQPILRYTLMCVVRMGGASLDDGAVNGLGDEPGRWSVSIDIN